MSEAPPIILVDGSSWFHRAFNALPPLTTSGGQPTNAVLGVGNMLRKLVAQYAPEEMVVIFDAKGPTFRHERYAEYKAHRPPMPPEMAAQIEPLNEVIDALGIPRLSVSGVEADDVIATLVEQARARGIEVLIATGDKDLAQLVGPGVRLVDTMKDRITDEAGVVERFGVPPERIADLLALTGDSSDNIPGVEKVGPKTAAKWINEYGDLDALVARADEVPGKLGENLRAALTTIPLARELVSLRHDLDLPAGIDNLRLGGVDAERLREVATKLEFTSWLREGALTPGPSPTSGRGEKTSARLSPSPLRGEGWGEGSSATISSGVRGEISRDNYRTILTKPDLDALVQRIEAVDLICLDTETTSLDYMAARIVGLSFAPAPGEAYYVPLAHDYPGAPAQLSRDAVLGRLKPLLEDPTRPKLGHHLKYDAHIFANHGIALAGIKHDSMLESYVLDPAASRHDMNTLASRILHHETIHYEDVAGKGAKQIPFSQVAIEDAAVYAAEDADVTLRLHEALWPRLDADDALRRVYEEIEIPLVPVLLGMERAGVMIDADRLFAQGHELGERLAQIERQAHEIAGGAFNLGSPKQLQEVLFTRLGIKPLRKTPTGQPSTAEDVLDELALDYPLPRLILEHRSLSKLKSTYIDQLPNRINPQTGRVHTSYHQAVTSTGRLSSSDPNLQNIPIRTEEGRRIRQAFVAPKGRVLLSADYSQIELRIMAHLSGDEGLLRAFAEGRDIHRATAAEVFGVAEPEVSNDQRRAAKAINFGLIYGMSAFGLARNLDIGRAEAQQYVDLYFARYPGVKAYMEATRERARREGSVETLFGRRLNVPDIDARNGQVRAAAERAAINAPMQGTAADIIKRAMIDLHRELATSELDALMILQVHDELVFEVAEADAEALRVLVKARMEAAAELKVPLVVETGVGENWDAAH